MIIGSLSFSISNDRTLPGEDEKLREGLKQMEMTEPHVDAILQFAATQPPYTKITVMRDAAAPSLRMSRTGESLAFDFTIRIQGRVVY